MHRALLVGLCAASLGGCSAPPAEHSLFPLEAGHRWTYGVRSEFENQLVEVDTLTLSTLGSQSLDGRSAWRRRSDSGVDYWLRSDASGIYRVASKSDLDAEPKLDPQPRYVLKMPLALGTRWQAGTTPYLLRRRQEFPRELRHAHPDVPMTYTIDALAQPVDTAAAHFDGCVRVRGEARVHVFADASSGWRDLPLTTLEWYCPGVGLVRLERHEPAASSFLDGGSLTMELQSWR